MTHPRLPPLCLQVVPKFLYGSHYSTAGLVLHFLMRQEPFATLAIKLQGGTFDNPNRLFFDLLSSWQGCQVSTSDVKVRQQPHTRPHPGPCMSQLTDP